MTTTTCEMVEPGLDDCPETVCGKRRVGLHHGLVVCDDCARLLESEGLSVERDRMKPCKYHPQCVGFDWEACPFCENST